MKPIAGIAVGIAAALSACSSAREPFPHLHVPVVDGSADLSTVEITLDRGVCIYGSCPAYTLRLEGNGSVSYSGRAGVITTGDASGFVDRTRVLALLSKFDEMDFLALVHPSCWKIWDASPCVLTLRVGDSERTLVDPSSGFIWDEADEAHVVLHRRAAELMDAIDEACVVRQWTGAD